MIDSSCSCWLRPPISLYCPSCSSLLIVSAPPPHMTFVSPGIGLGSTCIGPYSTTGKGKTKMLVTCIDNRPGNSVRYLQTTSRRRKIMATRPEKKRRSWALLLLLFPFFYWFQLLVVVLTAILTAALYFAGA